DAPHRARRDPHEAHALLEAARPPDLPPRGLRRARTVLRLSGSPGRQVRDVPPLLHHGPPERHGHEDLRGRRENDPHDGDLDRPRDRDRPALSLSSRALPGAKAGPRLVARAPPALRRVPARDRPAPEDRGPEGGAPRGDPRLLRRGRSRRSLLLPP